MDDKTIIKAMIIFVAVSMVGMVTFFTIMAIGIGNEVEERTAICDSLLSLYREIGDGTYACITPDGSITKVW